ncbi:probable O-methyltransferase 3 [Impatiens glandulifera]|uniref:probable O-methyltransferase 3 n=1 Tax=Impatiens glandulifera TaxID=253017 RepID=UPI001FB056B6|nr:probable O-methyltransferase 3 [Impatiens glandulifera]
MNSNGELTRAHTHLLKQLFGFLPSASLRCIVELDIPDLIHNHGKPMTLSEIIRELSITNPIKTRCLGSILRILAHSGIIEQESVGCGGDEMQVAYSLTPSSRLLLKEQNLNIRQFIMFSMGNIMVAPWMLLSQWLQNDVSSAFETYHGMSFWDFTIEQPNFSKLFNEAMTVDSRLTAEAIIDECKTMFVGLTSVVDVGGGTGTMATMIVKNFSNIKCKVFDLPHVVAGLQNSENIEFIGGDMFDAIPHAQVVLLKWVLHDWSDEKCVRILKKCKEAILNDDEKGGKLMIIEMVKGEEDEANYPLHLAMDVQMSAYVNGKERSEKEWSELFFVVGFTTYKITPLSGLKSLIEVYP